MPMQKVLQVKISKDKLRQVPEDLHRLLEFAVDKVAHDTIATAQMEMRKPKSGRLYDRGSHMHQASAPGEAPAVDLGTLINSMQVVKITPLTAEVQVGAEEGLWMELGTTRVAPRPFLGPALEEHRKDLQVVVKHVMDQVTQ